MDERDWQLLDKQMRNLALPPRKNKLTILILTGGFLAGIAAGSLLFEAQQSAPTAAADGKTALDFFLHGGRNPMQ
ncbi:MAG: hypothetical protein WA851_19135 [Xanthobacteraceae bacterium]